MEKSKYLKISETRSYELGARQTVDKVHFMDDVYSLFFYNRFMKTNARSDSYDV